MVRPSALATFPNRLHLESTFGTFDEAVERASSAPSGDVLWVTVKAPQLDESLGSVPESSQFHGVVPLLNGIDHVAVLRERFGKDRVIPATIAGESERVAPGRISHPSPFARLAIASHGRDLLGGTVTQLEKIGFQCRWVDSEATLLWQKLVFLAPIALTTTAYAATIGEILGDPTRKSQLEASVHEACAVAAAEGAKVDATFTLNGMQSLPAGMRSSMQKDVEKGIAPELDAIAGPILRGGQRHHVPVPATQALAAAVAQRSRVRV